MDFQIQQRVALVCGAGSGLGQAIALSLAQEGVKVAVTGRSADKLAQTVERITLLGGTARAWRLDLAAPEQFERVIADIRERWGDIDILVNNSGGPPPAPAQGTDGAVWQQQFSVMVASLIQLTDKLLPAMRSRGWGRIITTTSSGVITPIPGLALSNALRMSLLGWSKTLASEVAGDGVTVNVMVQGASRPTALVRWMLSRRNGKTAVRKRSPKRVVRAFRPGAMANRRSTAPSLRFWQASLPATLPAR